MYRSKDKFVILEFSSSRVNFVALFFSICPIKRRKFYGDGNSRRSIINEINFPILKNPRSGDIGVNLDIWFSNFYTINAVQNHVIQWDIFFYCDIKEKKKKKEKKWKRERKEKHKNWTLRCTRVYLF